MTARKRECCIVLWQTGVFFLAAGAPTTAETGAAGLTAQTAGPQQEAPEVTTLFGEFTTEDSDGDEVTQEVFSGYKLTMVNIWATFCSPCLRAIPQ